MPSSISAAQAALFDRLAASPGLAGVQVTYGPPDAYEQQEVVALLGVRDPREEPVSLGAGRKDETYQLEVTVKVHNPAAKTAKAVNERGRAIADVVFDEVEGPDGSRDYTLNGSVIWAHCEPSTTPGPQPAKGGGWVIFLDVLVTCKARIQR